MSEAKRATKDFDPKEYLKWFDETKALIERTPDSNLGWFDADLSMFVVMVQMLGIGGTFSKDSALRERYERMGIPKP